METTFITIHDLSPEARIIYSSDSIIDILGYSAGEVVNRSCWDFFHPEELPIARAKHGRGVDLDKAAVLSYCRMKNSDGDWVGCEVVFTVVYDVLVGCTSIYRRGVRSQNRALEAPVVRRLFSSSPQDPRYHMLSHLSPKFSVDRNPDFHEPRAALFLNRYTRTLTIMYATSGLADVLGIAGDELRGKSFYFCIQEDCLPDAVRCLENAKANDSIAYLRFLWRDPRTPDGDDDDDENAMDIDGADTDHNCSTPASSVDDEIADDRPEINGDFQRWTSDSMQTSRSASQQDSSRSPPLDVNFDAQKQSNASSSSHSATSSRFRNYASSFSRPSPRTVELEAVVSCTSDGLVVCLRQAHSHPFQTAAYDQRTYQNALFAVPWSSDPIMPGLAMEHDSKELKGGSPDSARTPSDGTTESAPQRPVKSFMQSIRDIAVFAWALTGINGSLAEYGRGKPRGESQPTSGLAVWQPPNDINSTASTQVRSLSHSSRPDSASKFFASTVPSDAIPNGLKTDGSNISPPASNLVDHKGFTNSISPPIVVNGSVDSDGGSRFTPELNRKSETNHVARSEP